MSYSDDEKAAYLEGLVEALSNGTTLNDYAAEVGVSRGSLYVWAKQAGDALAGLIAHAREAGRDAIAEDCIAISDGRSPVHLDRLRELDDLCSLGLITEATRYRLAAEAAYDSGRDKLRVWTRLQLLAKWAPETYGDRTRLDHAGVAGQPITIVTGVPQPEVDISAFE